jgi:bifunctional non-homologous end joining protein LigD
MPNFAFPQAAVPAEVPPRLPFQIVQSSAEPPDGQGWLHEVKHDGHRLMAIAAAGLPPLVLDGEIAVPDERGVTHIDLLTQAMRQCQPERLAYFAFDLLHLDGHDLRACAIEDRKVLLRDVMRADRRGRPRH